MGPNAWELVFPFFAVILCVAKYLQFTASGGGISLHFSQKDMY